MTDNPGLPASRLSSSIVFVQPVLVPYSGSTVSLNVRGAEPKLENVLLICTIPGRRAETA